MIFVFESLENRRLMTSAQDLTSLTALRADPAYSAINGSNIGVAILDTGTWAQHPDLRNNFVAYFDAVKNRASAAGSTKVTDAVDPDGHGTHVAGTAVSSNPNIGVATNADLIAVRVLPADNEAQPSFDPVANGLQWVLNNVSTYNIKVVNLSLGVPGVNDNTGKITDQESVIIKKLENVGVTVVAAAGNDYADFAPALGASTPGAYSTLVVSNVWSDTGSPSEFPLVTGSGGSVSYYAQETNAAPDRFAATSQRSSLLGEIAAPGTDILSTWNSATKLYQEDSGTSMASPFIAGTVALMQQAAFMFGGRYLTPDQVRTTLVNSADTIIDSNVSSNGRIRVRIDSQGNATETGSVQNLPETGQSFKRVNVYAAIKAVKALVTTGTTTVPTDPTPPSGTDPDATIATATVVPNLDGNATYTFDGKIGADGTVNVGAADIDVYVLTVISPGVVSAALTLPGGGTSFTPAIRLFDSAGNILTGTDSSDPSAYPTLVSARLAPGTYYLGISSTGNEGYTIATHTGQVSGDTVGDYTLTVGLANPDPNGVPQGSFTADLTAPNATDPRTGANALYIAGTLGSDPNPLDENGPRIQIGGTDVDMFHVVAPDDGTLTIDTLGLASSAHLTDGVRTFIRVFDANYNPVSITQTFVGGTDAETSFAVTRGAVYYVGISTTGNKTYTPTSSFDRTSTTGATGSYDAYFAFDNGDTNGTAYTATTESIRTIGGAATSVSAAIGTDGSVTIPGDADSNKDVDFYRYTVPASGLIDLEATPTTTGFQPVLSLWRLSADHTTITRDADTTGRSAHIITTVDAGETVYVSVTGDGNDDFRWFAVGSGSGGDTGAYTLTSFMRPASDALTLTNSSLQFGTPTDITDNTPLHGNIGTTNSVETGPATINLYRYVATATGSISIRASVPLDQATDPNLRLFDVSGNELAHNDDAAPNTRDALITYNVTAGVTYIIGVNGSSSDPDAYDPVTGQGGVDSTTGDYILLVSGPQAVAISGNTVNIPAGNSAAASVDFTITIPQASTQDITAQFATFDPGGFNSAVAGTDYTAVSRSITIPAGQTSVTVSVPLITPLAPGKTLVIGGTVNGQSATATVVVGPAENATDGPDLAPTALTVTPNGPIVPGDKVPATLTLSSVGTAKLVGKFSLHTVISADQTSTTADVKVVADKTLTLKLNAGATLIQKLSLQIPVSIDAGNWYIIATLTPLAGANDVQPFNNLVTSASQTIQWLYGTFTGHKNKKLTVGSAQGPITFSLSGPGSGTVTRDSNNLLSTTVSNTNLASTLNFTPSAGTVSQLLDVTIGSPLKALLSPKVSITGNLSLPTPAPKTQKILGR